jgi:hypothetical protein
METDTTAIDHKLTSSLSKGAYKLLNELVLDLNSKLKPEERVYNKQDNASYLYNMFVGGYDFSCAYYKEVYEFLNK